MDIFQTGGFSVEFEAAVLSPATEDASPARRYRVGWLLKGLELESASIRYRCFHFARVLAPEFESLYFTSAGQLQDSLAELDAVVIVKRIDKAVPALVAKANFFGVPVFLDLCDDMLAPGYVKNEYGVNLVRFLGIAPMLAGVTVPSAAMADRVEGYARDHGYDLSVHVVPDIAETWDIYRAAAKFAKRTDLPAKIEPSSGSNSSDRKRVLWFGNYGASHSNFGIFSLKPSLKSLKAVNEDIPLELVIVSNSESVYQALVRDCGFPTRYVPWSPSSVYSELASADVALLSTGDDDFCEIKSSCRVLQAFAAGVPVISSKGSAVSELDDAIALGRMQDALRNCLGPARDRFVPPRLQAARQVLVRYTPERLGGIWSRLLKSAIARSKEKTGGSKGGKLLFLVESGDDRGAVTKLLSMAKRTRGLDYTTLVSTDLLEKHPEFGPALRLSRSIPRFFSGTLEGGRNLLIGRSALIVERPAAPMASMLSGYAQELGIPVFTTQEALKRGLGRLARPADPVPERASAIHSIPFQEGLNADGSVDWAFVVHEKGRGWILDAICREIGSRQPASWRVFYYPEEVPKAKNLFFSHYAVFQPVLEEKPEIVENSNIFVWYTHPREETPTGIARLLLALEKATKVIFACESNRQTWIERGLAEEKTAVVLGAADPALFRFHERGRGVIGLSSSFYERKNPDRVLELARLLPHRDFLLLGRKWNQYALFEEIKALPNFTYKSAPYRDYPEIYSKFDVFLSMSTLEGGPIPLVEAMMSNAVPVASRTGFAPDLIRHGENGFIFDLDAPAAEIAELIEAAFKSKANVRETVEQYSWNNFSAEVMKLAR